MTGDAGLRPKLVIDKRHELVERLDDRGCGEVWKVCDPDFKTRFAMLKFLAVPPAPDGAIPAPLLAHVKRLRALRHPNLHPVAGNGSFQGRPYVAFGWFDGASLAATLRTVRAAGRRLGITVLQKLFDAVFVAVEAAHAAVPPVLHGGLSPDCVLVHRQPGGDFEVRVTDLGLAPWADPGGGGPCADCAAPERRTARALEPAADVYSLGMVLRHALAEPDDATTWVEPFDGYRGREDVPRAVWDALARAVRPAAPERFAAVAAFREALQAGWRGADRLPARSRSQAGAPVEVPAAPPAAPEPGRATAAWPRDAAPAQRVPAPPPAPLPAPPADVNATLRRDPASAPPAGTPLPEGDPADTLHVANFPPDLDPWAPEAGAADRYLEELLAKSRRPAAPPRASPATVAAVPPQEVDDKQTVRVDMEHRLPPAEPSAPDREAWTATRVVSAPAPVIPVVTPAQRTGGAAWLVAAGVVVAVLLALALALQALRR